MGHLDGYLVLLVVIVVLVVGLFYLGFIMPAPEPGSPGYLFWSFMRGRNRGGFLFGLAILLPLAIFALWQASRVESQVAEIVQPYPNLTETIWVPDVDGDANSDTYLIKTEDSVGDVLAFYAIPEHRRGWQNVAETEGMLQLQRDGQTLFIVATSELQETTVAYLLSAD